MIFLLLKPPAAPLADEPMPFECQLRTHSIASCFRFVESPSQRPREGPTAIFSKLDWAPENTFQNAVIGQRGNLV